MFAKFLNLICEFKSIIFPIIWILFILNNFNLKSEAKTYHRQKKSNIKSLKRQSKFHKHSHCKTTHHPIKPKPNETQAHQVYQGLYSSLEQAYEVYNQANNEALNQNFDKAISTLNNAIELFQKCGVQGQCMNILLKRQLLEYQISSMKDITINQFLQQNNIAIDALSSEDMIKLIDFYITKNDINQAQFIFNKATDKYPEDIVIKKISPKIINKD